MYYDTAYTYRKDLYYINYKVGNTTRREEVVSKYKFWLTRLLHPTWKKFKQFNVLKEND